MIKTNMIIEMLGTQYQTIRYIPSSTEQQTIANIESAEIRPETPYTRQQLCAKPINQCNGTCQGHFHVFLAYPNNEVGAKAVDGNYYDTIAEAEAGLKTYLISQGFTLPNE